MLGCGGGRFVVSVRLSPAARLRNSSARARLSDLAACRSVCAAAARFSIACVVDGEGGSEVRVVAAVAHYRQQVEQPCFNCSERCRPLRNRRRQFPQHPPLII